MNTFPVTIFGGNESLHVRSFTLFVTSVNYLPIVEYNFPILHYFIAIKSNENLSWGKLEMAIEGVFREVLICFWMKDENLFVEKF